MFAKSIIAAAALSLGAGTVFAADYPAPVANAASGLTRAAVQQELYRAQAAGEVVSGESYGMPAPAKSTRSSADEKRELQQAQAAGQMVSGELYGQLPTVITSTVSRQQVRADAVSYATHQSHSTNAFIGG